MSSNPFPAQSPLLTTLPTEVILHVLSFLSYTDLKHTLPLVSHHFHSLLLLPKSTDSSTPIDELLFRDAPRFRTGTHRYELHPSFDTLEYAFCAAELRDTGVAISCEVSERAGHWSLDPKRVLPLSSTRTKRENAVSPAATKVILDMPSPETGNNPSVVVKIEGSGVHGAAVTVEDLMCGVGQIARLSGQDLLDFGVHAAVRWDMRRLVAVDGVPRLYGDFVWKA